MLERSVGMLLTQKGKAAQVDADVRRIVRKALQEAAEGPNLIGTRGAWDCDPEHWDALVDAWGDTLDK